MRQRHLAAAAADVLVARRRPPARGRADQSPGGRGRARLRVGDRVAARVPAARRRSARHAVRRRHCRTRRRRVGHYFVGNAGDVDASGVSAGIRTAIAGRVHGSVEYSLTRARMATPDDVGVPAAARAVGAARSSAERIHDVATSIETDVPETSTRVSCSIASATRSRDAAGAAPADVRRSTRGSTCRSASRCRSWTSAPPSGRCCVAVRNFFRETARRPVRLRRAARRPSAQAHRRRPDAASSKARQSPVHDP